MTENSRAKGARGELKAAKMFRRWYPKCKRSVGQIRTGYELPDLTGSHIEDDLFIEVKYWDKSKRSELKQAWQKTISDLALFNELHDDSYSPTPILVYKLTGYRPAQNWFVALQRFSWLSLRENAIADLTDEAMIIPWSAFAKHMDETA